MGATFSGHTQKGSGVYGDKNGNISFSRILKAFEIHHYTNSSVFGFGTPGPYNIMQAANLDIGKDEETRARVAQTQKGMVTGLWAGLTAPFAIGYALEAGVGSWAFNNLIMNGGKFMKYNAVGGAADAAYQLGTKDAKDYNAVSTVSNAFLGPLPSAALGYTFNTSYNSFKQNNVVSNPFTIQGMMNIGIGTAANYGAGKLSQFIGVPQLRVGNVNYPMNNMYNFGVNVVGNSASDKVNEVVKP